jgi:ubiquinone biosynthesis protein
MAPELAREVLERELGRSAAEAFAEIDWEPLAAASIGQTYRARLRTGEPVVVKVQRPGIEEVMERDLAALGLVANLVQRRTPFGQSTRSGEVLDQFARSLRAELDFRREADAMEEMRTLLGPDSVVRIPTVYKELCTRRLLVQEQFDGFTVADSEALAATGYDRAALADALLRSMLEQVLTIGFFHADPHPGNVFVLEGGTLGLIDFGAVGRLDPIQQKAMVDLMAALVRRDVEQLREGIERVAEMAETVPPERLERSFARLMADHLRPGGTVDPSILQDLISTLSEFGIRLPGDLVVLSRALVTLDGTLGIISPGVSLVAATTSHLTGSDGAPIVDPATIVREELLSMLPHLRRLPDRLDRTLMLAGRGDLRVRSVVDEDSRRILRTLVNRGLLAVIGAAFLTVSTMLLVTDEEGPGVADSVGLYEIFGYGGLLAGTVLCLRVVAGVARDGTV